MNWDYVRGKKKQKENKNKQTKRKQTKKINKKKLQINFIRQFGSVFNKKKWLNKNSIYRPYI
jgi:2-oxo-4-hydroxy-4-carboxy--5-ureidoimidazoline (OHCU) decarboxylase